MTSGSGRAILLRLRRQQRQIPKFRNGNLNLNLDLSCSSYQFHFRNHVRCLSSSASTSTNRNRNHNRGAGLDITGQATYASHAVPGPRNVPSRSDQLHRLQNSSSPSNPYDILVIGGGATGSGIAFDAATRHDSDDSNTTKLRVACIERGDFASETSSRSTKLIWAGIRYLATASASLLDAKLFTQPLSTVRDFAGEIKMVLNCHRERKYMTTKQRHLTNWVPIAIPFSQWVVHPPPFGHKLFSLFPILAPFVLKIYDGMSNFTCPPSYVMGKNKAKELFPQLSNKVIKYCAVFYEAQHNDSRTNLAIAMSAAEHGAHIANYVEMIGTIRQQETHHDDNVENKDGMNKIIGVRALDRMTNTEFDIYSKNIIFAGGPFTDSMRQLEQQSDTTTQHDNSTNTSSTTSTNIKPAVSGASGTHIVLPGYYCPNHMGLLDYNTSDGRFLFFLPWEKHTLVGTTDTKCPAETLPTPPEDEVQWILNECGRYLSDDLRVRRSDVLSAWRGWRPLAADPHAPPDAPVSRDHVISHNPETGVIFIAGGKWTTWREMAEEVVDIIVGKDGPKSRTLDITLFGGDGYSPNLAIQLIQKHGMSQDTAELLAKTYGGRSYEVCQFSQPTNKTWPRFGIPLAPNYPYIDAEVRYATREYACTIEDIVSRRTRLAYLNKDAALSAIPIIADIMTEELGWTEDVKAEQIVAATKYVESYGGRVPDKKGSILRTATYRDVQDLFNAIDTDNTGYLDRQEVGELAHVLGFPLSREELTTAFEEMDMNKNGRVDLEEFEQWWNFKKDSEFHKRLSKELNLGGIMGDDDWKKLGSGTFMG